ncbi:MAG: UPF0262 family protein [Pseudomonadota bacterium]
MFDQAPQTGPLRLIEVTLDETSIGRNKPEVEQERDVAIYDLLEANTFSLAAGPEGPYRLTLSIAEKRLVFDVRNEDAQTLSTFMLSLTPFKRIAKDYFFVCETYFEAIRTAPPSRIEAIDMARRGLHDEGSELLIERLEGKVKVDFDTARRLFTLICALYWKG